MSIFRSRLGFIALLICIEMAVIAISYQVLVSVECQLTGVEGACRALRSLLLRGFSVFTFLGLFLWLRPLSRSGLLAAVGHRPTARFWIGLHLIGIACIFAPLFLFDVDLLNQKFALAINYLALGSLAAALGGIFWLASARVWGGWLRAQGIVLPLILTIAFFVPDFADALGRLWNIDMLSHVTFVMVHGFLQLTAVDVVAEEARYIIGAEGFYVQVASQCSGVEGLALVTAFLALYAVMLGREVHSARFWLVVFPMALLASWLLNVLRIVVLILIGAKLSPTHALNGFHSYAGWLLFTLLALVILFVVQSLPWLHKTKIKRQTSNLATDWIATTILPFVVLMLSGVIVTTFWQQPEMAYPYRMAAFAAVIWYFRKPILALEWRLDPLAVFAGVAIGAVWAVVGVLNVPIDEELTLRLSQGGLFGMMLWIGARVLGTSIFVPIIEELFFRGYILIRLNFGGMALRIVAIAISSGLFALLHDRWFEAFVAGVIFALLYLRSGRLADAIVAHSIANAIIAICAILTGNWAVI